MPTKEGVIKRVGIKVGNEYYRFISDDEISMVCEMVDMAENKDLNIGWDHVIEAVFQAKQKDTVIVEA